MQRAGWTPKTGLMVDWMGSPRVLAMYLTKPPSVSTRANQELHLVRLATVAEHITKVMGVRKGHAGNEEDVWKRPASTNWVHHSSSSASAAPPSSAPGTGTSAEQAHTPAGSP